MSFLERAANNVLQATEEITNRMEEGISALLTGELPKSTEGEEAMPPSNEGIKIDDDDFDDEMIEEEFMNSPLEGIADSVIGDLMAHSVILFLMSIGVLNVRKQSEIAFIYQKGI
jgi:hypothetical protein